MLYFLESNLSIMRFQVKNLTAMRTNFDYIVVAGQIELIVCQVQLFGCLKSNYGDFWWFLFQAKLFQKIVEVLGSSF